MGDHDPGIDRPDFPVTATANKSGIPFIFLVSYPSSGPGVGISGDLAGDQGKKMLSDYISQKKISWPNFYDEKGPKDGIAKSWGNSSWPTQFLVDKKGILRSTKADEGDRRKAIEILLSE